MWMLHCPVVEAGCSGVLDLWDSSYYCLMADIAYLYHDYYSHTVLLLSCLLDLAPRSDTSISN